MTNLLAAATVITGTLFSVVDGDTIDLTDDTTQEVVRVRLAGMDAPESYQKCCEDGREVRCGDLATRRLEDLLRGTRIICIADDIGRYDRPIAHCTADGIDVSSAMVSEGHAAIDPRFSSSYHQQERRARANKEGIWGTEFINPWERRRRRPTQSICEQGE